MNPNTRKYIVHLLSGGLDSVTMLYDLQADGHAIHCLLVNYGQKHAQELLFAKGHCKRLGVRFTTRNLSEPLSGSLLTDGGGGWVVPCRNTVLLALAVNLACELQAETVTIGCNADDAEGFQDCRPEFIKAFNAVLKAQQIDVEVCAPYLGRRKWEIGGIAREFGVPTSEIWSCYVGGDKPCGQCPACKKLALALA